VDAHAEEGGSVNFWYRLLRVIILVVFLLTSAVAIGVYLGDIK
jgi:hypothetical protein